MSKVLQGFDESLTDDVILLLVKHAKLVKIKPHDYQKI